MTPRIRIPQDMHAQSVTIRNAAGRISTTLTGVATAQSLQSSARDLDLLIDELVKLRPRLKRLAATAAESVESLV